MRVVGDIDPYLGNRSWEAGASHGSPSTEEDAATDRLRMYSRSHYGSGKTDDDHASAGGGQSAVSSLNMGAEDARGTRYATQQIRDEQPHYFPKAIQRSLPQRPQRDASYQAQAAYPWSHHHAVQPDHISRGQQDLPPLGSADSRAVGRSAVNSDNEAGLYHRLAGSRAQGDGTTYAFSLSSTSLQAAMGRESNRTSGDDTLSPSRSEFLPQPHDSVFLEGHIQGQQLQQQQHWQHTPRLPPMHFSQQTGQTSQLTYMAGPGPPTASSFIPFPPGSRGIRDTVSVQEGSLASGAHEPFGRTGALPREGPLSQASKEGLTAWEENQSPSPSKTMTRWSSSDASLGVPTSTVSSFTGSTSDGANMGMDEAEGNLGSAEINDRKLGLDTRRR